MVVTTKAAPLSDVGAVRHGFFQRGGGVSEHIYASLNCGRGSDDAADAVAENRRLVAEYFGRGADELLTLYQIHSPNVAHVTEAWAPNEAPQADAMVTNTPGLVLGILTADCAPVLFADREGTVVGAAHAGWRGAFGGVLEATVEEMVRQGADKNEIIAAIGPCISQAAYEVGDEFRATFVDTDDQNVRFFVEGERDGHWQFDLMSYVAQRLRALGVSLETGTAACTYQNEARYYSYRRSTHRNEPDYGRQVSAIMIAEG